MENLILYILQMIAKPNFKVQRTEVARKPAWIILYEDKAIFVFDQEDVQAFKDVYLSQRLFVGFEERQRCERFFNLCV